MQPMPARYLQTIPEVTAVTREELVSLGLNVYEAALKRHLEGVMAKLAGPAARLVFIPQIGSYGQIYRGLVLMPLEGPKMALKA